MSLLYNTYISFGGMTSSQQLSDLCHEQNNSESGIPYILGQDESKSKQDSVSIFDIHLAFSLRIMQAQ